MNQLLGAFEGVAVYLLPHGDDAEYHHTNEWRSFHISFFQTFKTLIINVFKKVKLAYASLLGYLFILLVPFRILRHEIRS